jgi:hypothetical protein
MRVANFKATEANTKSPEATLPGFSITNTGDYQ